MASEAREEQHAEVTATLVGRTITRAEWRDMRPDDEFAEHGRCVLWLDDGRMVEFSGWGYDAYGAAVDVVTVPFDDPDYGGWCG